MTKSYAVSFLVHYTLMLLVFIQHAYNNSNHLSYNYIRLKCNVSKQYE